LAKKNKIWIVRACSSPQAGGGHMMRSISLAFFLKNYIDVHFILDNDGKSWLPILEKKGFTAEVLKFHSDKPLIEQTKCVGVLIDYYGMPNEEIFEWKNRCGKLAIIDDFGDAPSFSDFVISPSYVQERKANNINQIIMTGPKYALLSNKYSQNTLQNYNSSNIKTILMSFGLYDSKNCTKVALDALEKTDFKGKVQIAIGSKAPNLNHIKKKIAKYNFNIEIFEDLYGLFDLYSKADLVIGAGGVSLLERMALGKPSITFVVSDNQKKQAEWAQSLGATISFYLNKDLEQNKIVESLNSLLSSVIIRTKMSKISKSVIDGKGALRASEVIIKNI